MGAVKDKTGAQIGKLLVLKRAPNRGRRAYWLCKCACGTIKEVPADNLNHGRRKVTTSCGCWQKETTATRTRHEPYHNVFNHLRKGARERNIEVDLSFDDFLTFTRHTNCHYCDDILEWSEYGGPLKYIGHNLDRKDNAKGYSVANCVPCCPRCNRAKSAAFSYEEWVEIGRAIKRHRERHRSVCE